MRALALTIALLVVSAPGLSAARDVRVYAAASLADVLVEIEHHYRQTTKQRWKLILAGSSTLARQIEAGAPADLFISADETWMDYLASKGAVDPASRRSLLGNALVVVAPVAGPAPVHKADAPDWVFTLGRGRGRIAVGDPAHVPVGRYARTALARLGLWQRLRTRIAAAADTRAALALVARGEAVAGITYATDAAASSAVRIAARIPATSHPPISYPIALISKTPGDGARRAYNYLCGPAAARIFKRHGFIVK